MKCPEHAALRSINDGIDDVQDKLTSTGEACFQQIGTSTQKKFLESTYQLDGAAGLKAFGFDIVCQMSKAITNIEEPSKGLVRQLSKYHQSRGNATKNAAVDDTACIEMSRVWRVRLLHLVPR